MPDARNIAAIPPYLPGNLAFRNPFSGSDERLKNCGKNSFPKAKGKGI